MHSPLDRRQLLTRTAGGMGLAAAPRRSLAHDSLLAADTNPAAPKQSALPTDRHQWNLRVRSSVGRVQVDMFDPKPELA